MKPREYCCCAIPLVNAGIYATLTEQFTLGILVGTLFVSTPSIVGAVSPTVTLWVLAIIAYVAAAVQVLGFLGVAKENAITFRRYLTLHIMATSAAFSAAVVWIIFSAIRHGTAQSKCETKFFPSVDGAATSSEGQTLCNIFTWVDIGIMGTLWVLLAAVQFYFYLVASSYSSKQQRDHSSFDADYDPTNPLTRDIPLVDRRDWDGVEAPQGYGHLRQESGGSISFNAFHQRKPSVQKGGFGEYDPARHPVKLQPSMPGISYPEQPENAYTQNPTPTPNVTDTYDTGGGVDANVGRPKPSQIHPGES